VKQGGEPIRRSVGCTNPAIALLDLTAACRRVAGSRVLQRCQRATCLQSIMAIGSAIRAARVWPPGLAPKQFLLQTSAISRQISRYVLLKAPQLFAHRLLAPSIDFHFYSPDAVIDPTSGVVPLDPFT
jgi:hypothetical protein